MAVVHVRPEIAGDGPAIRTVHTAAFGSPAEADLVDALRHNHAVLLSLVAERDGEVVGHILFSPVQVEGGHIATVLAGLAPLAVLPAHQRTGIGDRLVRTGLDALRAAGQRGVVVVGHPAYYPRFGFVPGSAHGLRWAKGHDESFFVLELVPGGLGAGGVVSYRPEFDEV